MSGSNTCQNVGKVNCCLPVIGDPRAVAGPLERGDAIVVGGGAVLAQHRLPVQPVTVGFILDHFQLAHIDRLALIQHQVVGLRQIDVALRLAHRPPRRSCASATTTPPR